LLESYFWNSSFDAMKIIIVDDNKTFRESLKYYLENILLHEVIEMLGDGIELIKNENSHKVDIILMDIEMPLLNGIETAKRALYENPALKIIAITNYSDQAYLLDLISAGFKACVFKNNIYNDLEIAFSKLTLNKMYFPKNIMLIDDQLKNHIWN